jgi:hypothetical protein
MEIAAAASLDGLDGAQAAATQNGHLGPLISRNARKT